MSEGLQVIGEELIRIGEEMKNGSCKLSQGQMEDLVELVRRASSPAVQLMSSYQICHKWKICSRTFHNWVSLGLVPEGHKIQGCKVLMWYSDEVEDAEGMLKRLGYLKGSFVDEIQMKIRKLTKML